MAKELQAADFVELAPNPHHQRAQLVVPTPAGERPYAAAAARQTTWAKNIAGSLEGAHMTEATSVLQTLLVKLFADRTDDEA